NMRYFEDLKKCHVIAIDASSLDFDDTHMQSIKDFKELEELDLKDTLITDKSLPIVGSFHNLKSLMLTRSNVTGEGLKYLEDLKKLKTLYINYLHLKKGTIAQLAPILPQLSVVNFGSIGLSKDEAKNLALLSDVGNLDLSCNSQIDDDCVKFLAPLKRLGILSIQDT